jgi:hypothetical protein
MDEKSKVAKEPKAIGANGEVSSHLESKTPPLKRKTANFIKSEGKSLKMAKKDIGSASASSLGVTQILEVRTQPLPFDTLSLLGSYLTSFLMTMKGKEGEGVPTMALAPQTSPEKMPKQGS